MAPCLPRRVNYSPAGLQTVRRASGPLYIALTPSWLSWAHAWLLLAGLATRGSTTRVKGPAWTRHKALGAAQPAAWSPLWLTVLCPCWAGRWSGRAGRAPWASASRVGTSGSAALPG